MILGDSSFLKRRTAYGARPLTRTSVLTCYRLATSLPPFLPYSPRLLAPRPLPVLPVGTTTRKRKALYVRMSSYGWVHVIAPGVLPFAGLFLPLGFTRFRCLFPPLGLHGSGTNSPLGSTWEHLPPSTHVFG
jgi:hypothetical protein